MQLQTANISQLSIHNAYSVRNIKETNSYVYLIKYYWLELSDDAEDY